MLTNLITNHWRAILDLAAQIFLNSVVASDASLIYSPTALLSSARAVKYS